MYNILDLWEGPIEINGILYKARNEIPSDIVIDDNTVVILKTNLECSAGQEAKASDKEYCITVRQYMTKKSTPDFDFMLKWNNDEPMPLRTMVGTIDKQTSNMYHMILRADTSFDKLEFCMKCGKPITNGVSVFFGMGPECGGHNYVNPFNTQKELNEAISDYKKNVLAKITWSGWVIKSAITKMEEV